jgi:hypothetical protein
MMYENREGHFVISPIVINATFEDANGKEIHRERTHDTIFTSPQAS